MKQAELAANQQRRIAISVYRKDIYSRITRTKGLGLPRKDGVTDNFYITRSATGGIPELTLADCAKVVACDFERNRVRYDRSAAPFIGILTHAVIYASDPGAVAVVHCHDSIL